MSEISLNEPVTTTRIDELTARARELQTNPAPEGQLIAEEALVLAREIRYEEGIADALIVLGWRDLLKGNIPEALSQAEEALEIAERQNNTTIIARACNVIGTVHHRTNNYSSALEHYFRSLVLHQEAGNRIDIASALGNIGNVYDATGAYEKAVEHYSRALEIFEELERQSGIALTIGNIGLVHFHQREFEKTLEYYYRALAIHEEIENKPGIALTLTNIAIVYATTGSFEKALKYFFRSLALSEEIGNKYGIANSHINIGQTCSKSEFSGRDLLKATEYLHKAIELAGEIGAKNLIYSAHFALSEVYRDLGDGLKAYEHFKNYHDLEREVHSEQSAKKIAGLEQSKDLALIQQEQQITHRLLARVLPQQIVERVKKGEENIADKFPSATVLFADIVGFTPLAEKLGADEILKLLSGIFSHFDSLCEKFGVEKIKTIGDSYMAASGVPVESNDHLFKIAKLALAMQEDLKLNVGFTIPELSIRIGIHTGEVVAGVLGTQKLSYDIWGDTVNTAARMESYGEPDMIHCSEEVYNLLKDKFVFKKRRAKNVKGKGKMQTYFLLKEK